jgi:arylsulfatase
VRPNVVLVYTDQQRYDTLGANGNEVIRTPNLDRLAGEGVSLDNVFVASPNCMPSRAAFATGRYPRINGVRWNGIKLPTSERTFMQVLQENGYRTALWGKLHLWPHQTRTETDPTFGFGIANVAENLRAHAASAYRAWLPRVFPASAGNGRRTTYSDELQVWVPEAPAEASFSTWAANDAIGFLESSPPEPFFLTVSFVDPHHPFAPPEPYASMYDPADVPLPRFTAGELDDKPPHFLDGHVGRVDPVLGLAAGREGENDLPVGRVDLRQVDDRLWGRLVGHYYGMISLIDAQVGRLLASLRETGLDGRTIVIFTSDHGELLGDHGLLFKGPHHYDSLLKVPTIVRVPGEREPGRRHGGLVEQIDLTSTILELCDVEPPPSMQGRSLVDALWGAGGTERESVLVERKDLYWFLDMKTLRTRDWKLTHYASKDFGELIDVRNDPDELVNLWDDPGCRAVKEELLAHLLERLSDSEDPTPGPVALA